MSCSTCKGPCPTPTACLQPERQFRTDFGVDGPYSRKRTRTIQLALAIAAVAAWAGLSLILN